MKKFNLKTSQLGLWAYTIFFLFGIPAIVWLAVNFLFAVHIPYLFWLFLITGLGFLFKFYKIN